MPHKSDEALDEALRLTFPASDPIALHADPEIGEDHMAHVIIGGPQGQLAADDRGAGPAPPVVFVHSDLGTRQHWGHALAHVSAGRRAAALDLRGHGESSEPADGDLSYQGRAADIGALVDVLGAREVILVAHSGGAIAALTYAVSHPVRVAGLVMIDPAGDPNAVPAEQREEVVQQLRGPGYRDVVRRYYTSIAGDDPDIRERVIADALATPQATIIGTFEALNSFEPRKLLGRYTGPDARRRHAADGPAVDAAQNGRSALPRRQVDRTLDSAREARRDQRHHRSVPCGSVTRTTV
jgi:pimeloyl-ACP methyl ester carboxylesterase